jgi:hypothetical protein
MAVTVWITPRGRRCSGRARAAPTPPASGSRRRLRGRGHQRAHASGLGQMPEQLAVRVNRAADKAAAVHAQEKAILRASLRHQPHRRHATRVGLDVVDPARLRRQVTPRLVVVLLPLEPGRRPAQVQVPDRPRFLARHRPVLLAEAAFSEHIAFQVLARVQRRVGRVDDLGGNGPIRGPTYD